MPKLTICPHFLFNYTQSTPEEISREIIKPLSDAFKYAKENGIEVVLSKEILDEFQTSYPWSMTNDAKWQSYLNIWHAMITQNINKCTFKNTYIVDETDENICLHLSTNINQIFFNFLKIFGTGTMPNSEHEEAIFANQSCGAYYSSSIFYILSDFDNIQYVTYPWLRIYAKPLPPIGEYKFIPPTRWRHSSVPIKGVNYGYLDSSGNEWTWDRFHNDHWDVQDGTPYTNVYPDGRIRT